MIRQCLVWRFSACVIVILFPTVRSISTGGLKEKREPALKITLGCSSCLIPAALFSCPPTQSYGEDPGTSTPVSWCQKGGWLLRSAPGCPKQPQGGGWSPHQRGNLSTPSLSTRGALILSVEICLWSNLIGFDEFNKDLIFAIKKNKGLDACSCYIYRSTSRCGRSLRYSLWFGSHIWGGKCVYTKLLLHMPSFIAALSNPGTLHVTTQYICYLKFNLAHRTSYLLSASRKCWNWVIQWINLY